MVNKKSLVSCINDCLIPETLKTSDIKEGLPIFSGRVISISVQIQERNEIYSSIIYEPVECLGETIQIESNDDLNSAMESNVKMALVPFSVNPSLLIGALIETRIEDNFNDIEIPRSYILEITERASSYNTSKTSLGGNDLSNNFPTGFIYMKQL